VATEDLKIRILAKDQTKRAFSSTKKGLDGVKKAVFSLKGALVGLGAASAVKGIITTASEVENLKVRLKFLTGSTQKASKAFQIMDRFASRVPFSLKDIQQGSAPLLTVADDVSELNELLEITGDIAAVSGLSFSETAMQLQRAMGAGIASADQFREKGISAFLGFQSGVSYSAEQTSQKIKQMWRDGTTTAKGATNDLAGTFTGQVSMMDDAWMKLQLAMAETGVFEEVTKTVQQITETFKDPETIKGVKDFAGALLDLFKFTVANADKIIAVGMIWFGTKLGGLLGKKGKIIGGALAAIIVAMRELGYTVGEAKKDTEELAEQLTDEQRELQKLNKILASNEEYVSSLGDSAGILKKKLEKMIPGDELSSQIAKIKTESEQLLALAEVANIGVGMMQMDGDMDLGMDTGLTDEQIERTSAFVAAMEEANAIIQSMDEGTFAFMSKWDEMAEKVLPPLQQIGEMVAEIFGEGGTLATGIGNATADAIMFGKDFGDSMKKLGQTIMHTVISSLVQMGVQMAINWAKEKLFKTASTALDTASKSTQVATSMAAMTTVTSANIAAGIATTAAWTPAAIMVSLATLGTNAIPAMAGMTATSALGQTLATTASFEGGGFTGSGSRSGGVDGKGGFPAILHPNETVVDHTKGQDGGKTANVTFQIIANDTAGFDNLLQSRRGHIIGMINQALNDQGRPALA